MPVSKKVLPVVDLRRKEAPAEREDKTAAGPSGPSGPSSSAGPTPAACPSPLNLSAESGIDNAERSSSVDSALSKVRPCTYYQYFRLENWLEKC